MKEIYEPTYVERLFDDMCDSYEKVNFISSFGFSERWRRQCTEEIDIKEGKLVVDLMTGMGECWPAILRNANSNSRLVALDQSSEMIKHAKRNQESYSDLDIKLLQENVFNNSIEDHSADYIISAFGLKTFNDHQLEQLSKEVHRILKTNGQFSLIEVSVPKNPVLRPLYMFYLKWIIPLIGKIFLGNLGTYRMLGVYTEAYDSSKNLLSIFQNNEFEVEYVEYFFGCATGIKGKKLK